MTLTINIYYKGKGGAARQFADEMVATGLVSDIRSKPGNLKYDYFIPYDDAETILLIDQWEKQTALDAHHQSETMQKILALRQKYDLKMTVHRFVDDQAGMTDEDKHFIAE